MRNRLMSMVFGFILIAAAVQFANAQECGCKHGGGEMHGGMMMEGKGHPGMHGMGGDDMMGDSHPMWKRVMELNLDEKQKDALKALHTKTVKDMIRKRADKTIAHVELQDLLEKEPIDMKAVEASAKKKEAIETDMFMAHLRAHEEVKALLTAEQRKKFKEMIQEGPCGCSMMHGGMMHHEKE